MGLRRARRGDDEKSGSTLRHWDCYRWLWQIVDPLDAMPAMRSEAELRGSEPVDWMITELAGVTRSVNMIPSDELVMSGARSIEPVAGRARGVVQFCCRPATLALSA